MKKLEINQNSETSPDNRGLNKEKPKKVNDAAAEVNRDIDKLNKKTPKPIDSPQDEPV